MFQVPENYEMQGFTIPTRMNPGIEDYNNTGRMPGRARTRRSRSPICGGSQSSLGWPATRTSTTPSG